MKNIKRKASDNFNNQIAPISAINEIDIDRYAKDSKVFMQELINIKSKQDNFERVATVLIQQNNEILTENKMLWKELLKTRFLLEFNFIRYI